MNSASHPVETRIGILRYLAESLILLAISVVLFRGFAAEGYLISTGSMAPTLLGYHRDVKCPECHFRFARGAWVASDEDSLQSSANATISNLENPEITRCPNCSYQDIPVQQLPRAEGDQLLVHKHAYDFRHPRRWETIVFRNPLDPTQAYVKRVVGLPGETIEIRNGNIYADGVIARKDLRTQRTIKLPVSDFQNRPEVNSADAGASWVAQKKDSRWEQSRSTLRYQVAQAKAASNQISDTVSDTVSETISNTTSSTASDGALVTALDSASGGSSDSATNPSVDETDWILYRNWLLSGGNHLTRVPLEPWPVNVTQPDSNFSRLSYRQGHLQCEGVFTDVERKLWKNRSDSPEFHQALDQLFERSHQAPVVDDYGYNAYNESKQMPVSEYFVSFQLQGVSGSGRFKVQFTNWESPFTLDFDFQTNQVRLNRGVDETTVREANFNPKLHEFDVEFSTFDQQVLVTLNGQLVFEPYEVPADNRPVVSAHPLRIGSLSLSCQINELQLERDLYYRAIEPSRPQLVTLKQDEYYVLGDNSPVSVDSRVWQNPSVSRSSLIGKPLVVHLPSKAKWVEVKGQRQAVRVPDFSRVRWIH